MEGHVLSFLMYNICKFIVQTKAHKHRQKQSFKVLHAPLLYLSLLGPFSCPALGYSFPTCHAGGNIIFCDQDNYLAFYMNVSSSNGLVGPAVEIRRTAFGAPAFEPIGVAIYNGTVYWLIAPRNTISFMPHYDAGNPFLDYTENEIVTFSKGRNIYIP